MGLFYNGFGRNPMQEFAAVAGVLEILIIITHVTRNCVLFAKLGLCINVKPVAVILLENPLLSQVEYLKIHSSLQVYLPFHQCLPIKLTLKGNLWINFSKHGRVKIRVHHHIKVLNSSR
jgi:hypothetical protein